MKTDSSGRTALIVPALLIAVALTVPASLILAQESQSFWGRTKVATPEATDEGDFYGTWWFHSKDQKAALWIKEEDGVTKVKMQLLVLHTSESMATDWDGEAKYVHRGRTGRLAITFDETGDDLLSGSWNWELTRLDWKRLETADIKLYRTGGGRTMVAEFDNFDRTYEGGASSTTLDTKHQVWVFVKGSRRIARWEELPF